MIKNLFTERKIIMNSIKVFNSPEFGEVRTIEINGEAWFVGKDVADILGYSNTNKAVSVHVDEEDKKILDFRSFSHFGKSLWNANDFSNKIVITKKKNRFISLRKEIRL